MHRLTVLPWLIWSLVIVAVITTLVAYSGTANAEPLARASMGNITITLYTDACELKEVANLPKKATWTEGDKTFTGCWGLSGELGLVMAYFLEDRSVAAIPAQMFVRLSNT